MGLSEYFKPIGSMTPAEVRAFLDGHRPGSYTLLDVRQPKEYERQHLPGAQLVPLDELPDRLEGLDPKRPTIIY